MYIKSKTIIEINFNYKFHHSFFSQEKTFDSYSALQNEDAHVLDGKPIKRLASLPLGLSPSMLVIKVSIGRGEDSFQSNLIFILLHNLVISC